MSLHCFDLSMKKKIKEVFDNTELAQEERLFYDSIEEGAILSLPKISIFRLSNVLSYDKSTDSRVRLGYQAFSEDKNFVSNIHSVPVIITYQIDIYSDKRIEVDELFKELSFYLYMNDSLHVEFNLSDDTVLEEDYTIKVIDNQSQTDFSSFEDKGRLYRETLNVEIPNADLPFIYTSKTVKQIPIHQYVMKRGTPDESL